MLDCGFLVLEEKKDQRLIVSGAGTIKPYAYINRKPTEINRRPHSSCHFLGLPHESARNALRL